MARLVLRLTTFVRAVGDIPASTPSAPLTAETLRLHNAATRGTCEDVYSQPSITSSMWNINYEAEDLPDWLKNDEAWTVEIGRWDFADVCMKLNFGWKKGENRLSLGWVVNQMKEKLGMSFSKDAVVVLLSPKTHVTAKLDHEGCYLKVREFLHKCILKRLDSNDFKVKLQYYLRSAAVVETFAVGCEQAKRIEKAVLGGEMRS